MTRHVPLIVLILPLLAACGSDGGVTVCEENYLDPIVTIAGVTDATTNAALSPVTLKDLKLDGRVVASARTLVQSGAPARNAIAEGQSIACTVACGFGAATGTYTMVVARAGYLDAPLSVTARYGSMEKAGSGCPITFSQGSSASIQLTPQAKN